MNGNGSGRIVLVVEDTELCSATLEIALDSLRGVRVWPAHTGEEAVDVLMHMEIAALITDVHLPRMDGIELVTRARALTRASRLPILVISGDSDPQTPQRALQAGADAFFAKPFSPAAVRKKLEILLNAD